MLQNPTCDVYVPGNLHPLFSPTMALSYVSLREKKCWVGKSVSSCLSQTKTVMTPLLYRIV